CTGKDPADVRFGSKADICSAIGHVRFTPESGHVRCTRACPLWANSGHVQCDQIFPSATRMDSGVIGCAVTRAAKGRNASLTAFMITAGAAPVPDSPTPLAPSSDTDVGVST